jgi:hypothetical protein
MIILSTISVTATATPLPPGSWKPVFASSDGPLTPNIVAVNLTFTRGNAQKIAVITKLMQNQVLWLLAPTRSILMINMDFTITYTIVNETLMELPQCFFESRVYYNDTNQHTWILEENHQLSITNFTGGFLFIRCQPFKLLPARFAFVGECDAATLTRM